MDLEIVSNKYAKLILNHKINDFSKIFEKCKTSGVKFLILVDNTLIEDIDEIIKTGEQYYYKYGFQPYVSELRPDAGGLPAAHRRLEYAVLRVYRGDCSICHRFCAGAGAQSAVCRA